MFVFNQIQFDRDIHLLFKKNEVTHLRVPNLKIKYELWYRITIELYVLFSGQ